MTRTVGASALSMRSAIIAAESGMTKFGVVFSVLMVGSAMVGALRPESHSEDRIDSDVLRNQRLTAINGAVLYLLILVIVVTVLNISGFLTAHYVVGLLLVPPVVLKLGSTGYRVFRYYTGSAAFKVAGPPPIVLRFITGPILVVATVVTLATGSELWLVGLRLGTGWTTAHTVAAVAMLVAVAAHLVGHTRMSGASLKNDVLDGRSRGISPRSLVLAALVVGGILAIGVFVYPSPFPPSAIGA
jgi:hypothetical protein